MMKRVATIQDISCLGKCSLTVALPIMSAMGIETAVVPTAVLSTHTAFTGFTFCDLTDEIDKIKEHWIKEGFEFDALYSGYLGSFRQLELIKDFFATFRKDGNLVVIDPVMADNGKLYTGFTPEFAKEMKKLCDTADIIVPNLTEAAFMLGIPYRENYDREYINDILVRLTANGAKKAMLTGIGFEEGRIGAYAYDSETNEFFYYTREKIEKSFHGTGDIFASTLTGALTNGFSFEEAMKVAVDYTVECMKVTLEKDPECWYGVSFESAIPYLLKRIGKM